MRALKSLFILLRAQREIFMRGESFQIELRLANWSY